MVNNQVFRWPKPSFGGSCKDMVWKLLLHSWIICVRQWELETHLSWLAGQFFVCVRLLFKGWYRMFQDFHRICDRMV